MYRFVVMIGSGTDAEPAQAIETLSARLRSTGWSAPLEAPGLRVFEIDARPCGLHAQVLPNSAGVVLGTIFESHLDEFDDTACRPWTPASDDLPAMLATRARVLLSRCWGNYVAVLRSPTASHIWVLKDPTGTLPCFVSAGRRITLLCSAPADLVDIGHSSLIIRTAYLQARVFGAATVEPSLEGIAPIHRGECVEFNGHTAELQAREFYWRPQPFAQSDALTDPHAAARAMRARVRACTHSWAGGAARVLHRLSGGLDSSIIAGCLSDIPNPSAVCCYTYFDPHGSSDVRPWARMAAHHAQLEHRKVPMRADDIDLELTLQMPPLAVPAPVLGYLLRSTIEQSLADETRATLVFNGDGGDSGFGGEAARFAAADFLRHRGWSREILRIASQVALRTNRSTGAVLFEALRAKLTGEMSDPQTELLPSVSRVVRREALDAYSSRLRRHPWFDAEPTIPWATIRRLGMLLALPEMYDVAPGDNVPQIVAPLYSQPVIETLLRIPLYRLIEDGRDRGLARRAFASDVPEPILNRLWKDRAPGFHARLIFLHRRFLREIFLDGILVREGLLDPIAIEGALSDQPSKNDVSPVELFRHLEVELWARSWARIR